MINKQDKFNVKNRSTSVVVYSIPEMNLRREWQPGEIKKITFGEMEQLSYQAGGRELMRDFLQIVNSEVTEDLGIDREPEYNMSEEAIVDLILRGSLDAFLDALDFAPVGVIDLIKTFSVSLPITDMAKREALKEKTGFDVDRAIQNLKAEKEAEKKPDEEKPNTERRVKKEPLPQGRRTSGEAYSKQMPKGTASSTSTGKYKVVSKK